MYFKGPQRLTRIFNEDGEQVLGGLNIISVKTDPSNQYPTHTLENGLDVMDHKFANQTVLILSVVLEPRNYVNTFAELKLLSNSSTKLTVQTKVDTHTSMYVKAYPYEESAKAFDTVRMTIELIEQITSDSNSGELNQDDVANSADSDTVDRGNVSGSEVPDEDADRVLADL
ncbi:hypothetical protein EDB29_1011102 [Vibrio crassostreae]|uniref:phage baseplate protein n=1 Tax=Vibrio crassostreae TaxID=246167 RepID=UPI001053DC7F|nr:hypothetical protein [Vibrio crassostreae]CAH6851362.1 conserved hypothetical protein [Vibrio chagasii]TCT44290.1 hypothetical protein EDB29_1011102 [Vibrio crassostreae]CAH6862975.1 conserved hypothetical protein [Vibrio chagasii]CAH6928496.1 conserved hypothetical protein [Vibrio chagasii]CAH6947852.1 conserved hypothetical protein [Vibrio chagasii]